MIYDCGHFKNGKCFAANKDGVNVDEVAHSRKWNCICTDKQEYEYMCHWGAPRYTGQDFLNLIKESIAYINKNYFRRYKGRKLIYELRMYYATSGHMSEFSGDMNDIDYYAAKICLLIHHKFKEVDDYEKVYVYELLDKLGIKLDTRMIKDKFKANKKVSNSDLWYDFHIEQLAKLELL